MESSTKERTALVAGATGLIGGLLVDRLIASERYARVIALVRRPLDREHPKLEERLVDFDALSSLELPAVDDIYCALGTTIATAGSREAFRRVDFTYVHELALAGSRAGARQFLLVSSAGADARSRVFYSRVKGEVEQAVSRVRYQSVQIFRPSILVGERSEARRGETIGIAIMSALSFAMIGPLRRYRPIAADAVAGAMIKAALEERSGVHVHESETLAN